MPESFAFNRDCMEAMREFPDGFFDLAVVDPPYGIGVVSTHTHTQQLVGGPPRPFGGKKHCVASKQTRSYEANFYPVFDDSSPPDADYFRELRRVAKRQIIWGGNFFDGLGRASCWIVWDKKRRGMDQADCELAWTNLPGQSRVFEFCWNGMLQGNMANKEKRIHPTQKPVALYRWLFQRFAKPGDKILDTHLGSGSSRIAAWDAGLDFWGYEISKVFFDLEEERFRTHTDQLSLFIDAEELSRGKDTDREADADLVGDPAL